MRGTVIFFIVLVFISILTIIGGGILMGCASLFAPFDPTMVGFLLIFIGVAGTISFSMLAGFAHENII